MRVRHGRDDPFPKVDLARANHTNCVTTPHPDRGDSSLRERAGSKGRRRCRKLHSAGELLLLADIPEMKSEDHRIVVEGAPFRIAGAKYEVDEGAGAKCLRETDPIRLTPTQ